MSGPGIDPPSGQHVYVARRAVVEEIAENLGIPVVPVIGRGPVREAVELCREGFRSRLAADPTLEAEGLVLRPAVELNDRLGHRVIAKIKTADFRGRES